MDKSIKKFVVILSVLAFVCLAAGWVFLGLMMLTIVAVLIAESIHDSFDSHDSFGSDDSW